MSNPRDCPHGRQIGKCADCDLVELYDIATELDMAKSTIGRLEREVEALRATRGELAAALYILVDNAGIGLHAARAALANLEESK